MDSQRTDADPHSAIEHRLAWLTRLIGAGVLALVAVTWKLWTPQEVFPRVPLFRWAPPDWWDWALLALIVAGGIGLLIRPRRYVRSLAATLAFGLAIAFVCDQHRLQPWAWQFLILALLTTFADDALLWSGWQWLTISVYFYSALSKFDRPFLDSMGHAFASTAFGGLFAWDTSGYPPGPSQFYGFSYALMWAFPVGELAVALLLAIPASRKWGMWAAVGMHGLLLQILGPFGLNHSAGVLLWNVFFIVQAAVLFMPMHRFWGSPSPTVPAAIQSDRLPWQNRLARSILAWVMIWPATYAFGLCDPWLAWAVYVEPSPSSSIDIGAMWFGRSEGFGRSAELLAASIIVLPEDNTDPFPTGRWSLRALRAPSYPHLRTSVAVALELAERFDNSDVAIRITSRPHGIRSAAAPALELHNAHEIHAYARRFWFNAYPTSMYRRAVRERMMSDDG